MTPRTKIILILPVIALVVIILSYFQLFADPLVIAVIFVLWLAVTIRNRRKFGSPTQS